MFNLFNKPEVKGMKIMKGIPNIISELYNHPSAITDNELYELEAMVQNKVAEYDEDDPLVVTPSSYDIVGDTAVIPIKGVILNDATVIEKLFFDICSLKDTKVLLDNAMANENIKQVLLDIDSGGGGVKGVQSMAAYIAECNKSKKVFGFVDGYNCSAAYWLSAGVERMFCTPCSELGSIGVICQLFDTSQLYERMGVKVISIKTGKYKGQGFDGVAINEEFIAEQQKQVDTIFGRFTSFVKSNRNIVDPEDAFQGQTFLDEDAIARGFADYLVTDKSEVLG